MRIVFACFLILLNVMPYRGGAQDRVELTIFAAASLREALESAVQGWPGELRMSFAGSGTIARQIAQGAPADVVLLANETWMDWLEGKGLIQSQTRKEPFANRLVLVGPADAAPLEEISQGVLMQRLGATGRLAMGEHRSVPAGQYARQWLGHVGLWTFLKPRLAEVENVRAALALVARGEVPLALLYQTDVINTPDRVRAVWEIAENQQPDIRYSLAATTPQGIELAKYLSSAQALTAFETHGFVVVPQ